MIHVAAACTNAEPESTIIVCNEKYTLRVFSYFSNLETNNNIRRREDRFLSP